MTALNEFLKARRGFCIFVDTISDGPTIVVTDQESRPCVFITNVDAQREIAENIMTRLQQFLDGERDFDDAITVDEYVVSITVLADGSVADEHVRIFGKVT